MNYNRIFLFIILLLIIQLTSVAQVIERETIKDLSEDWLYYDQNNEYLPLIDFEKELAAVHFHLALPEYKHYQLYMYLPTRSSIWINQKLVMVNEDSIINWPIDSLINTWGSGKIFISIYKQGLSASDIETLIIYERGVTTTVADNPSFIDLVWRQTDNSYRNFFVLGFVIILIIYAVILNVYSRSFKTFYDLSRTLSLNIREEYTFKGRALNNTNMVIIIAHSLLIGYLSMLIIGYEPDIQLLEINGIKDALWQWLIFSFIIFAIFLVKYFIITIMGSLFNLRELVNRHYLEYLRMSKIFFALLFIILCFFYLGFEVEIDNNQQIFINLAIIFLITRVIMLFFKFMRTSSFKNFYLFAYLCSTEFLPLVIGLKFILNI